MKFLKLLYIPLFAFGIFVILTQVVQAFEFPISELGGCRNYRECHLYCENPDNHAACWSYSVYRTQNVLGDETPEASLENIGITFPIAELGGCVSVAACRAYCQVPENSVACQTFSEKYSSAHRVRLQELAQEELGCTTLDECRTFCTNEENASACEAFAKRYHLKVLVRNRLVLAMQQELQCTDVESCKAMCSESQYQDRCRQIVARINPNFMAEERQRLVNAARQELGCDSLESCRLYCQDPQNRAACVQFGTQAKQNKLNRPKNILDCGTNEACRKVCIDNPDACPGFPGNKDATPGARPPVVPLENRNVNQAPQQRVTDFNSTSNATSPTTVVQ